MDAVKGQLYSAQSWLHFSSALKDFCIMVDHGLASLEEGQ